MVIGNTFSFENDLEDVEDSEILLSNQIDEYTDALLFLNSTNIRRLILSLRNIECINWKFTDTANITIGRNISIRLSTTYPSFVIKIRKADSDEVFCEINPILFTERGVYQLNIDNRTCKLKVIEKLPAIESILNQNENFEFQQMIDSAYIGTNGYLLEILLNKYKLLDHFNALIRYLLLGQGDFIRHLMDLME